MKKTLLSITACAAVSVLSAQVTITSNDVAPIYTQIRQVQDTTPTVTPGGSGASQTWNYSALNNQGVDTLTFTLPQFTPYGSSFPGANLSVAQGTTGSFVYLNNSSAELNIQGQAMDPFGNGTVAVPFSDPEVLMSFPSALGSSWIDTAHALLQMYYGQDPGIGFTVDSFRVHIFVKKTSDCDAWGSLTTPAGTYNVLRQNALRVEYDTIDIYAFGSWADNFFSQQDSDRVYSYWANGAGYPVCELTDAQDLGTITMATWLLNTAQVGIPENTVDNSLPLYPNPASGLVTFVSTGTAVAQILVFDVNGQLVNTMPVTSEHTQLDVSNYASGLYFYTTLDANGNVTARGKFNVAH